MKIMGMNSISKEIKIKDENIKRKIKITIWDFPGNNNKCWRQQGSGHKWRFLACDLDYTMGLTNLVSYDFAYLKGQR